MEMRQRNLLLGGGAVIVVAVVMILIAARSGGSATLPKAFTVHGICLACQKESDVTQTLGTYAPFKCLHCGKSAVYTIFFCRNCKKRFVPDLVRPDPAGPLRLPMGARCPACGSTDVCQYDAAMPDQHPVGDAPWPAWQP